MQTLNVNYGKKKIVWIVIIIITLQDEIAFKIKSTWVELTMITLIMVWMSSIDNMISIWQQENWKEDDRKT
jgi:hypothetical protein